MTPRTLTMSVLLLTVTLIGGSLVRGDDAKKTKPEISPQDIQNRWIAAGTPSDHHRLLEHFVGEWDTVARNFMMPGAEKMENKGTSKIESILGGRFVREHLDTEFFNMPYIGNGLFGYDNYREKFIANWVDSLHTTMYRSECVYDEDESLFTCMGTFDDVGTDERDKFVKYTIKIVSPDKHVIKSYTLEYGTCESKTMEMTYTRKNSDDRHTKR